MKYVLVHNGFWFGTYCSRDDAEKALKRFAADEDDYWEIFDTLDDDEDNEYNEEQTDFNLWAVFFS